MTKDAICNETKSKMEKVIKHLTENLKSVRTGRANTGLVENIKVEYYGTPSPLRQLAVISTPDAQTLVIKPYDASIISQIEKAILQSDVGLVPSIDGKLIRITIPPLTEERRKRLVVLVKEYGETAKVSLRNIRHDANKQADKEEKENILTEDDLERTKEEIQKIIREYEGKVNYLVKKKTEEIMTV